MNNKENRVVYVWNVILRRWRSTKATVSIQLQSELINQLSISDLLQKGSIS